MAENPNAKANFKVFQKMSLCERECGKTAEELVQDQRDLKEAFYARQKENR